jgi:hypothetical protein
MKNETNGKWQFLFVYCEWKTEMANKKILLFAANGKWKTKVCFSFISKRQMVIDDCCFSEGVHLKRVRKRVGPKRKQL